MLMVIVFLIIFGLCLGSFINALVWRLHEQASTRDKKKQKELSILRGRSVCPHCKHKLTAIDLIPVVSWVVLRGKCRYCKKTISWQYPLVELLTAGLLTLSYLVWPYTIYHWSAAEIVIFGVWTFILTGFVALAVYDIRWYLLPDKIVFPVTILAVGMVSLIAVTYSDITIVWESILGIGIVFGLFYLLFQLSKGLWIGGGDVKLGIALGLLAGSVVKAFLLLFVASILGTLYGVLLGTVGRQQMSRKLRIPFGPFLIVAAIVTVLFGAEIVKWYADLITSV